MVYVFRPFPWSGPISTERTVLPIRLLGLLFRPGNLKVVQKSLGKLLDLPLLPSLFGHSPGGAGGQPIRAHKGLIGSTIGVPMDAPIGHWGLMGPMGAP